MQQLVSINEAAARVGVSRRTMERWIASGNVRYARLGPRLIRLYAVDVAAMRRKRKPRQSAVKHKR